VRESTRTVGGSPLQGEFQDEAIFVDGLAGFVDFAGFQITTLIADDATGAAIERIGKFRHKGNHFCAIGFAGEFRRYCAPWAMSAG
jgi:hypothetical protein